MLYRALKTFFLFLVSISQAGFAIAQPVDSLGQKDFLEHNPPEVFKGGTHPLQISDILKGDKNLFKPHLEKGFNLKPDAKNNWIKIRITNTDTLRRDAVVELTNPFLYIVRFYTIASSEVIDSLICGSKFEFGKRQRNHPNFQYLVNLEPGATKDCYINIEVANSSGDFMLFVWSKENRNEYQLTETKYLSYFFIISSTFLLLLGLAILLTKQRFHWYYFIYTLFGALYIYAELGLGFKNIWPKSPSFQNNSILLIANMYQAFGLLFVQRYFTTKLKFPFLHKCLQSLFIAGLLFECVIIIYTLAKSLLPDWVVYANTIIFLMSGTCISLVASVSLLSKKYRADAIWFIIGFIPHAISITQLCFRPFGAFNSSKEQWFKNLLPIYIETVHPPNLLLWSVLWEMIIVFWLITNRLKNIYEENNNMMQQLSLQRESNMRTLLSGVDKERQRIAQDLHDGSGVALTALKMKLHLLKINSLPQTQNDETVEKLMHEVDKIYEDLRHISHNLMPKTLSKLGLYPAIDELIDQFKTAAPQIKFKYYKKSDIHHFSESAKINLYRILQELLTNVVKHANAKYVSLQIIRHNDSLMISIEDDGVGYDIGLQKNGTGLTSVESRVQMLHGNLSVDTAPQNGTFISIFLPVKNLN